MGSEPVGGVTPGGPHISATKKRRIAALDRSLQTTKQQPAPPHRQVVASATLPRPSSSSGLRHSTATDGTASMARSGSAGSEQPSAAAAQQQQASSWEPPYNRLDDAIATGPAAEALGLPSAAPGSQVVSSLLEALMATNPRAFDARAAIGLKVQDRTVMLENPVGQKGGQQQQQRQRQQQRQQQHRKGQRVDKLAARLLKRTRLQKLAMECLEGNEPTYQAVQPLHHSWLQYMRGLLGLGGQDLEARLYAADLHGCLMRVTAAQDRRYQGLCGIVVDDTANMLQLVTPDDRLVAVPKKACTWEFDADRRRVVTLLGPGLAQRGTSHAVMLTSSRPKTLREAIRRA